MAKVVAEIATWVGWKTSEPMSVSRLLGESRLHTFEDGSELSVDIGWSDCGEQLPVWVGISLAHDDRKVKGRKWVTEAQIRRNAQDKLTNFAINLGVLDQVPGLRAATLTRPKLMASIVESCSPIASTPGYATKLLTLNFAKKLLADIMSPARSRPIVIVSSNWSMDPPLDAERMRVQLLGLADLYQVTEETDGWALANILGDEFSCYGDAIRVVWPVGKGENAPRTTLLQPNRNGEAPRTTAEMENLAVSLVLRMRVCGQA